MNARIGGDSPWNDVVRRVAMEKVLLFIGVSEETLSGGFVGPVLQAIGPVVGASRPTGFVLFGGDWDASYKSVLADQNLVPVRLPMRAAIDDFLLEVCRKAVERTP